MQQSTPSRALHFPAGMPHRGVFWDGTHAASWPRCCEGSADLSTRALLILRPGSWKAMEVAANCSLRVKRPLLDPRFEGYKLSLEPLPCYQLELDAGGKRPRLLALFLTPLGCKGPDPSRIFFLSDSGRQGDRGLPYGPVRPGWSQGGGFWRRTPIAELRGSHLLAVLL